MQKQLLAIQRPVIRDNGFGSCQVGLAQCPLYFHELAEELDYLDGSLV